MKKLFCLIILFLTSTLAHAQRPDQIELPCPAGSSPTWMGQSYDQATGKYRQWQCVKQNGTVTQAITDSGNEGQVFNVKAYGAIGNGLANDSPAFQAAYNAAVSAGGGTVYIPPPAYASGCYLLNTAINMTENHNVIMIEGTGSTSQPSGSGSPGEICANTGGVLFDATNSSNKTWRDVSVTAQSGVTNPSLIGILLARNSGGASGQNDYVIGCKFAMPVHSAGTTYSFGAYLYGAELQTFDRDVFVADYPLVVTATNDFSVTSPFDTIGVGAQSEKGDSFTNMELDTGGLGNAVYFDATFDMTITGHSFNFNVASPYPGTLQQYALFFTGSNYDEIVHWDQEGFPGFLWNQYSLFDSQIYGTHAPFANASTVSTVHAVEFDDPASQISHVIFSIMDQYPFTTTNYYYDSTVNATPGVLSMDGVSFSCGGQANCGNIPVGNYVPGGYTAYTKNVTWSGIGNNPTPFFNLGGVYTVAAFHNSATNTIGSIMVAGGAPTGACVTGSLYLRSDGGASTTLYVCQANVWAPK